MVRRRRQRQRRHRRRRARWDAGRREARHQVSVAAASSGNVAAATTCTTYRGIRPRRPPRTADLGTGRMRVSEPRCWQFRLEGRRWRRQLVRAEWWRGRGAVFLLPAEPAGERRRRRRPPRTADLGTGRMRISEPILNFCRVAEPRRWQFRLEGWRWRRRLVRAELRRGRGALFLLPAESAGERRRREGVVVNVRRYLDDFCNGKLGRRACRDKTT